MCVIKGVVLEERIAVGLHLHTNEKRLCLLGPDQTRL